MAKIELKQPIVEEIASTVKDAATVVIVSYSGITVAQDTQLRRQLREAGVTYKVYKNTLMTRAFKGTEFEGLTESLKGTNAIAVCKDDATAPARILSKFAKDCPAIQLKASSSEASSPRSQTSPVCLTRLRRRAAQTLVSRLPRRQRKTARPSQRKQLQRLPQWSSIEGTVQQRTADLLYISS